MRIFIKPFSLQNTVNGNENKNHATLAGTTCEHKVLGKVCVSQIKKTYVNTKMSVS